MIWTGPLTSAPVLPQRHGCPHCGSDRTVDVTTLGDLAAGQHRHICNGCGRLFVDVEFRPWAGMPPGGGVHCGPAATVRVPTPKEILAHAEGLGAHREEGRP